MTSAGVVRVWHVEEGWGVIDSDATPGGCWVHYSSVLTSGFRQLAPGGAVSFAFEVVEQDGYAYRAAEAWPAGQEPARHAPEASGPSAAYGSVLRLTFDPR